eukprot:scaffold1123_cov168-Amphora_coffeaeformis.AAC.18
MTPLQQHFDNVNCSSSPPSMNPSFRKPNKKRLSMYSCASGDTMSCTLPSSYAPVDGEDDWTIDCEGGAASGFYSAVTQKLFPYHVIVNQQFQIVAAGDQLCRIMGYHAKEQILKQNIDAVLTIRQPSEVEWSWEWLVQQAQGEQQGFRIAPAFGTQANKMLRFNANIVHVAYESSQVMINMVPDATCVRDLLDMDLTMQDVPAHGGYRRALELQTRLNETNKTEHSRRTATANLAEFLCKEKELLESLVPKHVAQGLRLGETVAPRQHDHVTFFFSDVKGFTDMCKQLYPWQVCGMLNRLYCVMDYLLDKFGLFKVETIGDAYVCCAGIPEPDTDHATKVANFAIAVSNCVKHVLSPVDGQPIQLRIGVHTGSAASGVVGVNNPRFGDTVNVTARHESSGEAGRVHISAVTQRLLTSAPGQRDFDCVPRGMVEMKGKGHLKTYWLEAGPDNEFVNDEGMVQLEMETNELLTQTKFESELEKETQEKTVKLVGKLGEGNLSDKQQQVMGPVLDIIRKELASKNIQLGVSTHSADSSHSDGDRRRSLAKSKSWDAPDEEQAKKMEKHFGKNGNGYVYTPKQREHVRASPTRSKSNSLVEMISTAAAPTPHHLDLEKPQQSDLNACDPDHGSLVDMVGMGLKEESEKKLRRGGKRKSKYGLPALPPAQLFDILEKALEEFDEDF